MKIFFFVISVITETNVGIGQVHYPFENKKEFEDSFPADFIAEGADQTRGWFYTLMVISTALFDRPPFKNLIVNGLVLAEDGAKMSKFLKTPIQNMYYNKAFGYGMSNYCTC